MNSIVPDLARRVTLRQLAIFEAMARHESVTRAAEELYLTQPTASMQVKKLSDALGVPLFEQVGRRIHLTDAGRELYESCQEVFGSLGRLEMGIAEMRGLKRGVLKLSVVTTAKYFAPHVMGTFKGEYPGIQVSLKVSNRERILDRLADNEDDLYIMGRKPEEGVDVEAIPIAPNPLVTIAARDHPLVGVANVSLARLAEEPFIDREPGSGIREATHSLFHARGLAPNTIMELSSNEAIKHTVASGMGISVLSLHSLTLEGTRGPLAILDVEDMPIERYWYVVYPRGKKLSVVARAFLDFMLTEREQVAASLREMLADLPFTSERTDWITAFRAD
ncbi:MAG: LysR substrate-binding domain-containing protein [Thiohalospira sp.]